MAHKQLHLTLGLPGLNEIIAASKKSPFAYARMKKKYTRIVADDLLVQDCIPEEPYEKMYLNFAWTETAQSCRDPDNVRVGAKFVLDAMVQMGLIEDDTGNHVRLLRDSFLIGTFRSVEVSWNKINMIERRAL